MLVKAKPLNVALSTFARIYLSLLKEMEIGYPRSGNTVLTGWPSAELFAMDGPAHRCPHWEQETREKKMGKRDEKRAGVERQERVMGHSIGPCSMSN